jgi:hypothetical protein
MTQPLAADIVRQLQEENKRLREALFGLRYSHGCWCERKVLGGELHCRACEAAEKALNTPGRAGE